MHIDIDIHNNPDLLEMLTSELVSPRFNWYLCPNVNPTNSLWFQLPERTPRFFRLNLDHRFIQWQCHDTVGHYFYGDATSIKCTRDLADLLNFIEQTSNLFPPCPADGYSTPLSHAPADPTSAQEAKNAFDKAYLISLFEKQTVPAVWHYPTATSFKKIICDPPYSMSEESKMDLSKLAAYLEAPKAEASKHCIPVITATQKPVSFADYFLSHKENAMKYQLNKKTDAIMEQYLTNHMHKMLDKKASKNPFEGLIQ